jgi:hypothetical protein
MYILIYTIYASMPAQHILFNLVAVMLGDQSTRFENWVARAVY